MISLSNVASAGSAMHYFSQDNYYTQEQGLQESAWFGQGASALGLQGKVDKEEFAKLLRGHVDGQELGKIVRNATTGEPERDHRPGTDMTFSAPKSVSLLAEVAGRRDVREAHEAAVHKALTFVEKELSGTRFTRDGETVNVRTGNLAVAMFRHNTSRDLDPQTHTHAVIMNMTRREDGVWRSLDNTPIYDDMALISAIYTAELASQMQALGYEITRTDDKGNFEIAGISREPIEAFSQRRAEIEASLKERGIDIRTATREQRETATLMTRGRKTQVDHGELIGGWLQQAQDLGIDFQSIIESAKVHLDAGGYRPQDAISGRDAMTFAASHLFEREAVVDKTALLTTAIGHGAGRVGSEEVLSAFEKLERDGDLVRIPDAKSGARGPRVPGAQSAMYTSRKMISSERWSLEQIQIQKGQTLPVMTAQEVSTHIAQQEEKRNLDRTSGRKGRGGSAARSESGGRARKFAYTEGQKEALTLALTTTDRYVHVQGLAGTGKTTMLKALNSMATDRGMVVRGMAPTGAASQTLSREAGIASDTVSMFVIKERKLQDDIAFAKRYTEDFERRPEMWVVDESSFLSQKQKSVIDAMAQKAGSKVVYLGDILQLQGVEAGKPFELAQSHGVSTAYMTEISRQKTPDMKMAVAIITGQDRLEPGERLNEIELAINARAFAYMDKVGMVREIKDSADVHQGDKVDQSALVNAVVRDVLAMQAAERANTLVITPFNKDRHAINAGVRAGLRNSGELQGSDQSREVLVRPEGSGKTRAQVKESQYYKVGDVIRSGRDYKTIDLKQGEYARVSEIRPREGVVVLQKENGRRIDWQPLKHNKVEVYQSEVRDVAPGDMIRITRNSGELTNGTVAKVAGITGSIASLEVHRGDAIEKHKVDLDKNKHWDYAYASTVHASQGSTQQHVLFVVSTPESTNAHHQERQLQQMGKVFADRSFYVGVTRASHSVKIYTNDKETAARAVGLKQDKTSALQFFEKVSARTPDADGARKMRASRKKSGSEIER